MKAIINNVSLVSHYSRSAAELLFNISKKKNEFNYHK